MVNSREENCEFIQKSEQKNGLLKRTKTQQISTFPARCLSPPLKCKFKFCLKFQVSSLNMSYFLKFIGKGRYFGFLPSFFPSSYTSCQDTLHGHD